MKLGLAKPSFGRLLMGLGLLMMVLALSLHFSGVLARQAQAEAEQLALAHVAEVTAAVAELQERMADPLVERAALGLLGSNRASDEGLVQALDQAGLNGVLTAQVFTSDLEELPLGEYPNPDFTTLEMLLEARRSGSALLEGRVLRGQPAHVALAQRLPSDAEMARGVLLVRLPVERLAETVAWAEQLDFVAFTQGPTELWRRGDRPSGVSTRAAVPGTRLWLEWYRSTIFPAAGLQQVSIIALSGLILLLLGMRSRIPARALSLPLPWLARRGGIRPATPEGARAQSRAVAETAAIQQEEPVQLPLAGEPASASFEKATPPEPTVDSQGLAIAEESGVDLDPRPSADPAPERADDDLSASAEPADPSDELEDAALLIDDLEPAASDEAIDEVIEEQEQAATDAQAELEPLPRDLDPEPAVAAEPAVNKEPDSAAEPPAAAKPTASLSRSAEQRSPVEPRLFTDAGILGRFDAGLDARSMTLIGQGIAAYAAERGVSRIAVARDGRLHGPVLLAALTQGLRSGGLDVVDFGAVPSPLLDYAALQLPGKSAVMVSAAHLPGDWNGLRVMVQGRLLVGSNLHDLLDSICQAQPASRQGRLESASVVDDYVQAMVVRVQLERPLKVVVDCANTVAGLLMPRLLNAIGADVIPLYADVDGAFPHHLPDPSRLEHLEDLRLCVRNFRADLGLAIGGDGDRLVAVAPDGSIVWPDRILMLLAREVLARQAGATIIQDAMCSPRVAQQLQALGGQVEVSGLGPAGVASSLRRGDAALGATFAGQFFLTREWRGSGDAIFAACRLLEILASQTQEVAETLGELPAWISLPPAFLPTRPNSPDQVLDQLLESADVSDAEVGGEHGFSIDFGNAWSRICRSADGSGLLVRFEGDDEIAVERLRALVRQLLLAVDERLQIPF